MNHFSANWAAQVITHRVLILWLTAIAMVLAPLSFKHLYHDSSNESYFLEHDPQLVAFNGLVEKFGDPEYLLIGIAARSQDPDIFTPEALRIIDALTEFLEDHTHVTQVRSLSKYQYTHDDNGMLATDDLFDDLDALADSPELLTRARNIIRNEPLAQENLVTSDLRHTRILARTEYLPGENAHKVRVVHDLQAFIQQRDLAAQGFDLRLSGMPVIGERFETMTQNDMAWINPVMGVIMIVILFLVFRSVFATLVPLIVILSSMLLVTSLQGFLRWPFTAVNSALIPTIIILSMGTSVHVLVEYFQLRKKGREPKLAARETMKDLFFAVLFTCVTTSIGFIALSVTELVPVRQFAVLAAIAPLIIFLVTMTSLPALLSFIPWLPRKSQDARESGLINGVIQRVPAFTQRFRKPIVIVGVLITGFSFYSVSHITVDANIVNYFKKDSWINRDLHYFNDTFKGISNLEVVVDSKEDGGVKNPEFLQRVDALQSWLASFEQTGKPTSVVDFYKQINRALNGDNHDYYRLPSTREMAAQFLLLYENTGPDEDLSDLKDFNERYLRIQVPMKNMDETETTAMLDRLAQGINTRFQDLDLELTGNLVMNNTQNHYVNNGMYRSFIIAIAMIGVCFVVLFRSFKYGMIALLPSVVPILLTGGVIAFSGIALDLGTMIVGAMTIGIAVDDSIHMMSRYLLKRSRGLAVFDAVDAALQSSGRAVILTSVILVTGFSVMLMGSFVSYIYVGLFSAMIMLLALIGDLVFMPAVIFLVDGDSREASVVPEPSGGEYV